MRIAVTGGAGYIGSVVTEVLIKDGHEVLVLDNLVKGHRDAVAPEAIFAEIDLLAGLTVAAALRGFRCEAVIHMAAASLVGESVIAPAKYYRQNVVAGLTLLDAIRDAGVRQLVFSSTAAVYGEPAKQPIEEDDPTRPTNPYGDTKLTVEHMLRWYADAYGLSSSSLRYFNAAGATELNAERHDPETHLIPLVLDVAAGRRPHVTIFGDDYPTLDGTCIRDYVHVEDLARAHVLALGGLTQPGVCRAYNLGCGGTGYSVLEVIDTARQVTGRDIPIQLAPRRPGDPARLVASSDRIRRELGWTPRYPELASIISSAWEWLRRRSLVDVIDGSLPNRDSAPSRPRQRRTG
jgi:UDP-glucose 4-epimerase